MDAQDRVARFVAEHEIEAPIEYRLLDLASKLGELAKEVNESAGYGAEPDGVELPVDELGDAMFALLALCERTDVNAGDAVDSAIEKYEGEIGRRGDAREWCVTAVGPITGPSLGDSSVRPVGQSSRRTPGPNRV